MSDDDILQLTVSTGDCSTTSWPLELVKGPVMLYVTPSTTQCSNEFLVINEALHMNVTLPLMLVGSLRINVGVLKFSSY